MNETIAKLQGDVMARYRKLVLQAATGGEVDPEAAIGVISGVGRSAAQLAADVERLEERLAAEAAYDEKAYLARIEEAKTERAAAMEAQPKLDAAFESARQKSLLGKERYKLSIDAINRIRSKMEAELAAMKTLLRKTGDAPDPLDPQNWKLT